MSLLVITGLGPDATSPDRQRCRETGRLSRSANWAISEIGTDRVSRCSAHWPSTLSSTKATVTRLDDIDDATHPRAEIASSSRASKLPNRPR
jgi:hypothetical protein